ncbi:putative BAG domain-containing protein [Helianthus annuus]|nr:putative BAG domain-containing protein [Helianthus annuus]KAJ0883150.1 putative BAG domain-containing protein [Helianthus annuus]
MNQLPKLDGITADGDVKLHRKMQVKRVQKYVETLDVSKIKNSTAGTNGNGDAKQVQEPQASQRQEHIISNRHMNAASPNQDDRYQPPLKDANRKKGKCSYSVLFFPIRFYMLNLTVYFTFINWKTQEITDHFVLL